MIDKSLEIARREWEHIRHSLEMCGDIGEFNAENFVFDKSNYISNLSLFVVNLIEMDEKSMRYGYATPEALDVFTTLSTRALERLGFSKEWALAFGYGYGYIRTGWLGLHEEIEGQQMLFSKMFFPLGASFNWDFDHSLAKIKLQIVFESFRGWQDNPQLYTQNLVESQDTEETWKEWGEVNE